jgi:methyltransferase (TIGR00027 family)
MIENRLLRWIASHTVYRDFYPVHAEVVCRSRFTEDHLEEARADGVCQYVILGAGFDSFALRRSDLVGSLTVFEIDHPATQAVKRARIAALDVDPPKHAVYIPVDFEHTSLAEEMARSSFAPDRPAFFSWLGTIAYLTPEAVFETFRTVASQGTPGSRICFDYIHAAAFSGRALSPSLSRVMRYAARRGEPITTGLESKELADELEGMGLRVVEDLSTTEIEERYLAGRADLPAMLEHNRFACAKVERRPCE